MPKRNAGRPATLQQITMGLHSRAQGNSELRLDLARRTRRPLRSVRAVLFALFLCVLSSMPWLFGWDRVLCVRWEVDDHSGDMRRTYTVLFVDVWHTVTPTEFSTICRSRHLDTPGRTWQFVKLKSVVRRRAIANSRYSQSLSVCKAIASFYGSSSLPQDEKDSMMRNYVKLFRSGDIDLLEKTAQEDLDNNRWRLPADY